MYKVGTFSEVGDQSLPGVYSRLNTGSQTLISSLTFGGVALPWPTHKVVSEPEPIEVRPNNLSTIVSDEKLADPDFFKEIGANILSNATTVYLCPYNRRVQDTLEMDKFFHPPEGWSEDGTVHVQMELLNSGALVGKAQPLVVEIFPGASEYQILVSYPWQDTSFRSDFKISKNDLADGTPYTKKITFTEKEDEGEKRLFDLYGKENLSLIFSVSSPITKHVTVVLGGGFAHNELVNKEVDRFISTKTPGLVPGALIAFEGAVGTYTEYDNCPVLYIPEYTAPAGSTCFAVAELRNWEATLTLYMWDSRTKQMSTTLLDRATIATTNEGKVSSSNIIDILKNLEHIEAVPSLPGRESSEWKQPLKENATVRVGFASFHSSPLTFQDVEMQKFLSTAGKTGSSLIFYVPHSDFFGKDIDGARTIYQKIQRTYLEKTGSLCPTTQLVMDETWFGDVYDWDTKTNPMTVSSPFCVSTAGDSRGGVHSLRNSAYMVGLMARCGEMRTATATRYAVTGGDLRIYTQPVIEHMHDVGVMTWHSHMGEKMVYIDSSSYRKNIPTPDSMTYPDAFERNTPVRAVNKFRFEAAKIFIANYFEKNWYGANAENSIKNDILTLIRELADAGIFAQPESQDVTVQNITSRAYHAEVKLRLIESPEILYISLEV